MSGGISRANIRKTLHFFKRNGFKNTCYAIGERLAVRRQPLYRYTPPGEQELERQRAVCRTSKPVHTISIVVPCYRTNPRHLSELIESVRRQTYPLWELILADATEDESVERVVRTVEDSRIFYVRLAENKGIAENTNRGIERASGDYVGLLDHDDLLTPDALYRMAVAISRGIKAGIKPALLYSDEDKCDSAGVSFYEPNFKEDFNLDLLLSNNYICHFMVMEQKLIKELKLRQEYEGAQDYDLVLRAAAKLAEKEGQIVHVPKVLYHWRCHEASTAENPESKLYAYDAGRRAVQSFLQEKNWAAVVKDTIHLGFYDIEYPSDIFNIRKDVGAVGGPLIYRGRIYSGRLSKSGKVYYRGLNCHYSGYLHRAMLHQDAEAVDLRNIRLRPELKEIFKNITGVSYKELNNVSVFDVDVLPQNTDILALSISLGKAIRDAGYRILYLPQQRTSIKSMWLVKNGKSNNCYTKL